MMMLDRRERCTEFDHAVCAEELEVVATKIMAIGAAMLRDGSLVYDHIRQRSCPTSTPRVYLARNERKGTVAWMGSDYTDLLVRLSREVEEEIRWVSVFGPMRIRNYMSFFRGEITHEILDPEQPQRTNMWSGRDLAGLGPRRFKSLQEFLKEISPRFAPVDWVWHFGRWDNEELRRDTLAMPECRIRWAIQISGPEKTAIPVGEAPDEAIELAEDLMRSRL